MKKWYRTGPKYEFECSCGKYYNPFAPRGLVQITEIFRDWNGFGMGYFVYTNRQYKNIMDITN